MVDVPQPYVVTGTNAVGKDTVLEALVARGNVESMAEPFNWLTAQDERYEWMGPGNIGWFTSQRLHLMAQVNEWGLRVTGRSLLKFLPVASLMRTFADECLEVMVDQYEQAFNASSPVVLNRGLPDLDPWMYKKGLFPLAAYQETVARYRYAEPIFLLDQLPMSAFPGGKWPREIPSWYSRQQQRQNQYRDCYSKLGYEVVSVPPVSVEARCDLIESYILR